MVSILAAMRGRDLVKSVLLLAGGLAGCGTTRFLFNTPSSLLRVPRFRFQVSGSDNLKHETWNLKLTSRETLHASRVSSPRLAAFFSILLGGLVLGGCQTATPGGKPVSSPTVVAGVTVPQGSKLAVVDPTRVLNESEAGKRSKDSLAAFTKNRQSLMELEEKELKRMEEDFIRQASVLSASAKKDREEQFRRRMTEYQQKGGDINREIQERQREVLEGFREKVEKIVGRLAQQENIQMVIEKGKGGVTIFSEPSLDLSDRVIEEMNKMFP